MSNISNGPLPMKRKKVRATLSAEKKPRGPKEYPIISLLKDSEEPTRSRIDGSVFKHFSLTTRYYPGHNPFNLCEYKDKTARAKGGRCYYEAWASEEENSVYFYPTADNPGGDENYVRKFRRHKKHGFGYYYTHVNETDDFKFEFVGQQTQAIAVTITPLKGEDGFKVTLPAQFVKVRLTAE